MHLFLIHSIGWVGEIDGNSITAQWGGFFVFFLMVHFFLALQPSLNSPIRLKRWHSWARQMMETPCHHLMKGLPLFSPGGWDPHIISSWHFMNMAFANSRLLQRFPTQHFIILINLQRATANVELIIISGQFFLSDFWSSLKTLPSLFTQLPLCFV